MASSPVPSRFPSAPTIILVADLTGFAHGFLSHSDSDMAVFLDRFYRMADDIVGEHGGTVIKFIGDAVLCVFAPDAAAAAVSAAITMQRAAAALAVDVGLDVRLGANIHMGDVVTAELGTGASRRVDVIGRAVNQAFLLGRGGGIRVSERVYRKLPSADRTPWDKRKPPAVYVLGESAEPYEALGKGPEENAQRW
jgi:adenylate cyclase